MKPTILAVAFTAAIFCACNQGTKTAAPETNSGREAAASKPATEPLASAKAEITDPVCGMVKDSTWTDYTLYNNDTVWFCAATEKAAFLGNPAKYAKKLSIHSSN